MSWTPPDGAPAHASLVRGFANTLDVDEDTDLLSDCDALRAWLNEAGLLPPGVEVEQADLELAREVREGLRAALTAHGEGAHGIEDTGTAAQAVAALDELALRLPVHVRFAAG